MSALALKGKVCHLLKKGAKLIQDRKPVKKDPANFEAFKKKEEENMKMRRDNTKIYHETILFDSIVAFLKSVW